MKETYIKVSTDFDSIKEGVAKGKLKWSHYAVEDEVGYHYYLQLK